MSSSVEAVPWDKTIQAWLDDYPSLERHELERRLASRERVAALFELLLYATLKRHRAQVVVHPTSVSKTANRPDFLAVFPDGHEVVFESVMVNELSVKEVSTSNAWAELLNHINRVDSDFWIYVDRHPGPLPSPPPPRKVKAFLERELAKLALGNPVQSRPGQTASHSTPSLTAAVCNRPANLTHQLPQRPPNSPQTGQ